MIRVLVADDSATTRQWLVFLLREDPEFQVVGEAKDGLEAVELTLKLRPDIVAMDIVMPEMDGIDATKRIMAVLPTPIVIVSNVENVGEIRVSLQALKVGALTVIKKPAGPGEVDNNLDSSIFVSTLKIMSKVKLVPHWPKSPREKNETLPRIFSKKFPEGKNGRVIAIAASTGGPAALNRIFSELPGDFPVPILVVQQMAKGFVAGCVAWMNENSSLRIKVAEEGERPEPGTVYLSGESAHLGVSDQSTLFYSPAEPIVTYRPSGTFLFESAAKVYGSSTLALVLTGMGVDGAAGLNAVKKAGGWIMAQDQESSAFFGMPEAAIKTGCVNLVLPLPEIAPLLMQIMSSVEEK